MKGCPAKSISCQRPLLKRIVMNIPCRIMETANAAHTPTAPSRGEKRTCQTMNGRNLTRTSRPGPYPDFVPAFFLHHGCSSSKFHRNNRACAPENIKHHCLDGSAKNPSLWQYQKNELLQSILSGETAGPGCGTLCRTEMGRYQWIISYKKCQ